MPHIHHEEDPYAAERGMVSPDPQVAAYDPEARIMRSLAAVGTVFGTVAAVLLPFGLIQLHQGNIFGDARVPIFDAPVISTSFQALWMVVSSLTGAALGALLLAGSVGALSFRRWAWPLLFGWSLVSAVYGTVGIFFFGSWLLSPWRSHWAEVRGDFDSLVTLGGWAVGTALAVVMLCLLIRLPVKMAFEVKSFDDDPRP